MKEAVIVSAVRTAVGKAPKGTLKNTRPDDLGAAAIKEAVSRAGVDASLIDDVIMGCAFPEAEQGMNVARTAMIAAGFAGRDVGDDGQSILLVGSADDRVWRRSGSRTGGADVIVAGGLETMSMIPMGGNVFRPNPAIVDTYPDYYLNMGLTAENLATQIRDHARAGGRVFVQFASKSPRRDSRRQIRGRDRSDERLVDELDEKGRVRRKEIVFAPGRRPACRHFGRRLGEA